MDRRLFFLPLAFLWLAACAQHSVTTPAPVSTPVPITKTEAEIPAPATPPELTTSTADDKATSSGQKILSPTLPLKELTLVAVGDMMLGGSGTEFYRRDSYDYAFAKVHNTLQSADLFIGNIETALTTSDELLVEKKYRFRNPPELVAAALARAGLDVANLANNHSLDYGYSGLEESLAALHNAGINTIGAGVDLHSARRAAEFDIGGTRIAFLAYSNTFPKEFWAGNTRPGTAFGHEHHVRENVQNLKQRGVDIVVVSFHWGREGSTELRDYQPLLAHAAIDAGAALVIGHHPHILQAVEHYADGVIFYSLGNFTFGSYSRTAQDSAIAKITIRNKRLHKIELIPIDVYNPRVLFQPRILHEEKAQAVIQTLQTLSALRGTALDSINERAVLEFPAK